MLSDDGSLRNFGSSFVRSQRAADLFDRNPRTERARPPLWASASVRRSRQPDAAGSWERNAVSSQRVLCGSEGAHFLIALVTITTPNIAVWGDGALSLTHCPSAALSKNSHTFP